MDDLTDMFKHGVFLRRHAVEHGYTDRDLARAVRGGRLIRVRHGAYVDLDRWNASDEVIRHLMACRAVLMTHEVPAALSHVSGAALHGLRLWDVDLRRVHVTRLGVVSGRKHHDVAYHDAPNARPVQVDGAAALSAAHCALGTAADVSVEAGIVVLDSAYHLGVVTEGEMRAAVADMNRWPGTARLQITLRLASPGSESVGESRARYLFWSQGLPRPQLQYEVRDGGALLGFSDFAWPERGVFGEFDGRVKYQRFVRPGETPADVVVREKLREDRMRELTGWTFIRLTWADLARPRDTAARIRRALRL
jgi:hypothetical protein